MKEAAYWDKLSVMLAWVSALLAVIALLSLAYWFYTKRRYIQATLTTLLANVQMEENFVFVPKTKAQDIPFFTLHPETLDELTDDDIDGWSPTMATSITSTVITALFVAFVVAVILWRCARRLQWISNIGRTCFPLYPIGRVLCGKYRSDIFVEVTNAVNGKTIWAHFASVPYYPTVLKVNGNLNAADVELGGFCGVKYMDVKWNNITIIDLHGKVVKLKQRGYVSIFTEHELDEIEPETPYHIRIMGRVLDQIMVLHSTDYSEPAVSYNAGTGQDH